MKSRTYGSGRGACDETHVPTATATSTGGRRSGFFTAEKLAPGNLGLLQQYPHEAGQSLSDGCPQPVEADIRAFGRHSGFDPEPT
jgi:hypothetical protein